jgi:TPP-dependent 2-oxoacid decarboxylase
MTKLKMMLGKKTIKFKKQLNQLRILSLKVKYYLLLNFWLRNIYLREILESLDNRLEKNIKKWKHLAKKKDWV